MATISLFSAERRLLEKRHTVKRDTTPTAVDEIKSILAGMRGEIAELRGDIAGLCRDVAELKAQSGGDSDHRSDLPQSSETELLATAADENALLRTELRILAKCINKTKSEITAIRPIQNGGDHILIATNELDAVVASTEEATQKILDSVEAVETIVRDLRFHVSDSYVSSVVDDVLEKLVTVLEACNFQDITGQRITKVINTMKYIEDRVNAMIQIWDDPHQPAPIQPVAEKSDADLLNGPQLSGQGCSQDDIDKMFG